MANLTAGEELKAEDVLKALEQLSQKEFQKFKWYLQQPGSLCGFPPIYKSNLEGAEHTNIVDLIVQTYTLQRCLEVISTIFEKINRNDLLQSLRCYQNSANSMCPLHKTRMDLMSIDDKTLVCRSCTLFECKQFNTVEPRVTGNEVQLELRKVKQFAVGVTLDPDTAHRKLKLSDDGKQVYYGDNWQNLPNNLKRFTLFANVLGQQSFSKDKFYFEVQVKGKTHWDLGVARESVDRKGKITVTIKDGFWAIVLRNGNQYSTGEDTSVLFHLHPGPEKVGVFVDYDQGLVSFYDVDAAALIYSFTGCCFKEKLYPYLNPGLNHGGKNSAPMIICPVKQADQ